MQEQIDAAGLSGKAFLMGATNDVGKALQTADLFVLSSDYEGMPNALMEAMAAGVPCISTDCPCGGPRELLGDNARNKLVPCGAVQQLKMKLIEQLESSEAGKAEKKRAELFQPKRVNALWEKYLQEIIDR
ncbi:glycosyltransferase [Limosilactobacillus fermentum]|uniref:glycosyltransferase n=1 Tax=Limosilactobacillus fermentum TaxID=1613 RepID=UPI00209C3E29|nr:glycosyltransferase [Limosilactobacillus fermentum]MCO8299843.1 glycosyltransferase [Limosilactobacillus fermentum]